MTDYQATEAWAAAADEADPLRAFRDELIALGTNATVRRNRGTEIDAACGQLAAGHPVTLAPKRD